MNGAADTLQLPSPLRGTLLVRDCLDADAGFLLVHIIKATLAAEGGARPPAVAAAAAGAGHCSVVLLAAAQAASHYTAVLRKAGLSLPALVGAGRLTLVELLPQLAAAAPGDAPLLQTVHSWLAAAIQGSGSGGGSSSSSSSTSSGECGGMFLVVDDLTVLHSLANSASEWRAFLHACVAVGQAPGSAFVGLVHGGVPEDEGWLARLEHAAAVVLEVEPLESGRSADTTGRLMLTVRDCGGAAAPAGAGGAPEAALPGVAAGGGAAPGTRLYCYKLSEVGARYVEQAAGV